MNRIYIYLLLILCLPVSPSLRAHTPGGFAPGCCLDRIFFSSPVKKHKVKVGGCEAVFYDLHYYESPDGKKISLNHGFLSRESKLRVGKRLLRFSAGTVWFYPDGSVMQGVLAGRTAWTLRGRSLLLTPGETSFYEEGSLKACRIPRETELPLKDLWVSFEAGSIGLHKNGAVQSGVPAREMSLLLGGRSFLLGPRHHLSFYADGTLERVYFKETSKNEVLNLTWKGRDIPFSMVWFHADGKLKGGYPAENIEFTEGVNRFLCRARQVSYFNGVAFFDPHDTNLLFHDDETLQALWLEGNPVIRSWGRKMRIRDYVVFYKKGRVRKTYLAQPAELALGRGRIIIFTGDVEFYPNGSVRMGDLPRESLVVINGKRERVEGGCCLLTLFYPDGRLHSTRAVRKQHRSESFSEPVIYRDYSRGIVEAEGKFNPGKAFRPRETGCPRDYIAPLLLLPKEVRYYWIRYKGEWGKQTAEALQVSHDAVIEISGKRTKAPALTWVPLGP